MRNRNLVLTFVVLLLIGGLFCGNPVQETRYVEAQAPSETPSSTPSPTQTVTVTPTAAPVLQYVSTVTSGQAVAIQYTVTAGEALNAVLEMILIGLVIFGLFIVLVDRR